MATTLETEKAESAAIVSRIIMDLSKIKVPIDCLGELHEAHSTATKLYNKLQQKK